MAYTKVVFENTNTGDIKEAPVGFSWTVLFFSFFPPLIRRDWKWGGIIFICQILSFGLSALVFMFLYNKLYIKGLIDSGYKAKSIETGTIDEVSQKLEINIPTHEGVA